MRTNDNVKIHVDHHRAWDEKVKALTGGLTIFRAGRGKWVDPETGITYEEQMIPVRIFCGDDVMEKIVELTLEHYDQIAVAVTKISEDAFIYTR